MKHIKKGVTLTREEFSVLTDIAERVLVIMEREGNDCWRDAESPLITLTDKEMELACDITGCSKFSDDTKFDTNETT